MSGLEVGPGTLAVVAVLATVDTLVIAGLPNLVTFHSAYAPPAIAAGVPIELLPCCLSSIQSRTSFCTVSNVTADLAVTSVVGREKRDEAA